MSLIIASKLPGFGWTGIKNCDGHKKSSMTGIRYNTPKFCDGREELIERISFLSSTLCMSKADCMNEFGVCIFSSWSGSLGDAVGVSMTEENASSASKKLCGLPEIRGEFLIFDEKKCFVVGNGRYPGGERRMLEVTSPQVAMDFKSNKERIKNALCEAIASFTPQNFWYFTEQQNRDDHQRYDENICKIEPPRGSEEITSHRIMFVPSSKEVFFKNMGCRYEDLVSDQKKFKISYSEYK